MCRIYKNKIQKSLIALVIQCVKSHIDCIWNETVNGTGWVRTDFVIKIPRGDDKMFNFTKPFSCTQTNSFSMVYLHDNLYLYECIIWRLYYIFLCLCSLPSILCCSFMYLMPNGIVYNAIFLNFLLRLIFLYLSTFVWQYWLLLYIKAQNVIKTKPFWI